MLSTVYMTQLASIYVGLARGVDPGPIEMIDRLKSLLPEGEAAS
jgi:Bacterial phospho-glucose isomerase C-terminal SIS domain